MESTVLVALVSLVGTIVGSLGGIVVSSKLTNYRLEQLEKKVDKHNNFAEKIPLLEEKLKVANSRISDLEKQIEKLLGLST
ncbi:MAG: hypothetical protein IJH52_00255 [Oscillospiraceae bacterium]|nr:hypothetical protein [Oscillospiraceae bacterium]